MYIFIFVGIKSTSQNTLLHRNVLILMLTRMRTGTMLFIFPSYCVTYKISSVDKESHSFLLFSFSLM